MTATVTGTGRSPAEGSPASSSPLEDSVLQRRHRRRMTAICLVSYAALAVLAFLPTSPFASRAFPAAVPGSPAGADPYQMAWFLAWFPYAVAHGLNIFHTNLFDYPTGVNLADNTSVPVLGLLAWPITATLGPVAAFNFLIRLAVAASGASMFLVLRRFCSSTIAPFVGGLLYAFGPYMAGQELHLDLTFVPIPPLLVLCGDELVRGQRMRPWRLGALIGAATAAQLLISPDVLSGCLVLALGTGIVLAVRHRHEIRERLPYLVTAGLAAAATFALIAGYPIYELVAGPSHVSGPVIPIASLQKLRADLLGPIVPTKNERLVPHLLARWGDEFVRGNLSENGTYLGVPLLLLLVVIVRRLRHDVMVRALSWLALTAFVLSLGAKLTFGTLTTAIPLPEAVFQRVPLLDNTIPARYALYVALFASMILAIGIDRMWVRRREGDEIGRQPMDARWRRRLGRLGADTVRARSWRIGIVAAVVGLSLLPIVPFRSHTVPSPADLPATVERVVPRGAVLLTYPFATPLHPGAMLWEASAGMNYRLMGGYANIEVGSAGQRWPALLDPPFVQEILGYTNGGDHWPHPGRVDRADLAALPLFLNRYAVGAVVYWAGGSDPVRAYNYLREALGRPHLLKQGFAIWLPANGRWAAAASAP
jgi:hypothetical protein